jgi:hypothetical protein
MTEVEQDVLARTIAGFGLPGAPEPEPTGVSEQGWGRLMPRVRSERITGLAVESEAAGWLELTEAQASELLTKHRDAMTWCLSVERKLVSLADAFDAEDISFAVLKGASAAHAVYAEPCLRSFADLDLLVGAEDYERACALLESLGHERRQPEPRPGFDVRFGRASVHTHPDDGVEVDLHRTPGWGPFGQWIRPEELLDRSEGFILGGRHIGRLDDTGMLLNVAMHACLGARSHGLVPLRDVLQIATKGDVEWGVLSRWAREWRLAAVFQHAFATASATLTAPVPAEAKHLLDAGVPERDKRVLRAYTGGGRNLGSTAIATLGAIRGMRGKAAYVRTLVLPDPAFLAARAGHGQRPSYVRRLTVPAGWLRRRVSAHVPRIRSGI